MMPYWRLVKGLPRKTVRLLCDSGEITRAWALAGHGVALKLLWDIEEDLAAGRLQECLGDAISELTDLFAVYPQQRCPPARLCAFLN